ncbi:MAG TPA: HAD family hydrolase, partial [bacterium]|nr:HAD family hydrolase [bacterium]
MSVAFFDVDDTILRGSSGVMLAKYMFFTEGEGASPTYIIDMVKALIDSKTGSVEYESLVEKGLSQFSGRSRAEIDRICHGCFDKYIRHGIYRLAYREVRNHLENGRHVVLLTAILQPLMDPLGDFLGVTKTIALNIHFNDG